MSGSPTRCVAEHRDRVDDRHEHLRRPVEQPVRLGAGMEEDRADDPERRRLEGDVVGDLVDPMGGPLGVGQLGHRALAGEDEDQVVRVDALAGRARRPSARSRRSAPTGRRGSRSTRACSARRTGGPRRPSGRSAATPRSRRRTRRRSATPRAAPGAVAWRRAAARRPSSAAGSSAARGSVLGLEAVLADRLDDGRVGEGRRVAERPALGDVAEEPAHDLAASGSSAGPA